MYVALHLTHCLPTFSAEHHSCLNYKHASWEYAHLAPVILLTDRPLL